MTRNFKCGKIAVVVFITILIWVWADLALDEKLPVSNAAISVVNSDPKLWVSFNGSSLFSIEELIVKGPLRRITDLSKKIEEQGGLKLDFDAAKEKINKPDSYSLPLLPFLRKAAQIDDLGLKVESCKPEMLSVKVVGLVSRLLDVKCVDEDQNPIDEAAVKPEQVEMLVPENWGAEKRIAEVFLTPREIEQARVSPIEETPYIKLTASQIRQATKRVTITMPPEPDRLTNYTLTAARLGIALSPTLVNKCNVEVTNLSDLAPIYIKATPDAKRAYELQPFPLMTLYILDSDKDTKEEQLKREVVYNFPEDFVRKGEIKLNRQQKPPGIARFKLTLISSAEASKGPPG